LPPGLLEPLFLAADGPAQAFADPEPLGYSAFPRPQASARPGPVRAFVDLIVEALQDHPLLHAPVWPRQPNGFENQPSGTLRPRRERHDSVANRAPR